MTQAKILSKSKYRNSFFIYIYFFWWNSLKLCYVVCLTIDTKHASTKFIFGTQNYLFLARTVKWVLINDDDFSYKFILSFDIGGKKLKTLSYFIGFSCKILAKKKSRNWWNSISLFTRLVYLGVVHKLRFAEWENFTFVSTFKNKILNLIKWQ